jgi:hypothetical protein
MIGSTLEDENYAATNDIKEMLKANSNASNMNLILETGGATGKIDAKRCIDFSVTQRLRIINGTINKLDSLGPENMGKNQTLSNFIKWGMSEFPAKKYGLILWDHGLGIGGFGKDTNSDAHKGTEDVLSLPELRKAFSSSINQSMNLEFVGFDACLMGTVEIASVLSSPYQFSKYLIASEETIPDWGWNYTTIVNSVSKEPGISGDLLGHKIIKSYIADSERISKDKDFNADRDITLSVLDLARVPQLKQKLDELVNSAKEGIRQSHAISKLLTTVGMTEHYGSTADIGIIDLYDFITGLVIDFPPLKEQAATVKSLLDSIVMDNYSGKAHPNSKGISVYWPLSASENSNWHNWVNDNLHIVTYSPNWHVFAKYILSSVETDYTKPVLQSERNGDTITVHLNDNDTKAIYLSTLINSSKGGNRILYVQNLDPSIINSSGLFSYNPNKLLEICYENTCVPMSMTMDISKNVSKIFVPVNIVSKDGTNSVVLSYEHVPHNNTFLFLGGLPEDKGGGPLPKQKVSLEKGDIIQTHAISPFGKFSFNNDSKQWKMNLDKNLGSDIQLDSEINVIDPSKVMLKWVHLNQSTSQLIVCDFADNCDKSRWYDIIERNNATDTDKEDIKRAQSSILAASNTTSSPGLNNSVNLKYVNERYNFTFEFPSDWVAKIVDLSDPEISSTNIDDPYLISLSPANEILNTTGSGLPTELLVGVFDSKYYNDPKSLFNYFSGSENDPIPSLNYEIVNSSDMVVDGNPGFEFTLKNNKQGDKAYQINEPRYTYHASIIAGNREYDMAFEAPEHAFRNYSTIVKNVINSMKFNKIDLSKFNNTQYKLVEEKRFIDDIRTALKNKVMHSLVNKSYKDPIYHFKLVLPYMDELNNVRPRSDPRVGYIPGMVLPSTNLPFENSAHSSIDIQIVDKCISKNLENLTSKLARHQLTRYNINIMTSNKSCKLTNLGESNIFKMFPGFEELNLPSNITLKDGSFATVDEVSYTSPVQRLMINEKTINTIDNGLFVSIRFMAPPAEYDLYKPLFDEAVRSFEFIGNK